ncbi:MAG: AMP-binding protein [bacterium]|nr:AMP-binding protein [bacterium]
MTTATISPETAAPAAPIPPPPRSESYVARGGETPLIEQPIHAFLAEVAARFPSEEAVVSMAQVSAGQVSARQSTRLTYARLFRRIDELAKGLLALGVSKGDRVGIWAVNNVEWLQLQIATARIGAVLVNVNPAYRPAEVEHALRAARVQTLFVMPSFRRSHYVDMMRGLCPEVEEGQGGYARFPELRHLVVFDPESAEATERPAPGFLTWGEVLERGTTVSDADLEARAATLEASDAINIQFTSGTTGFAKPVVLSHRNILNNGFAVAEVMRLTEKDRLCVPVPFYHCFGMVLSNLATLSHGATLVIPAPHFDPADVLAAVEQERCTALHGVPTMFVAELELEDFDSYDLSSLRTGIMAGAPCPPKLMRQVIGEMGCREILIGYGQTEASPVTHITRPTDSFERRVETVGTNLPHQEAKVVDPETGATVPVGVQGELCFRGYHVMRGYFEQEEATREAIDMGGWLHSGDLGVMDADGYVRITGRLKDMIIRGGENIYPAEIEAYLLTHPKVAQAAVFGIPHERWGEEVGAWIRPRNGDSLDAEELQAWARERLSHFKVPRYLRIVDDFPMTVTGKIQKFRIREMVEAELRDD